MSTTPGWPHFESNLVIVGEEIEYNLVRMGEEIVTSSCSRWTYSSVSADCERRRDRKISKLREDLIVAETKLVINTKLR